MRIAHFSDLHLLSLEGARILDFANKRWIGGLNLLANRGREYHTSAFEAMIADLDAGDIDHAICTGDVTNLALEQEFRFARAMFDTLALGPAEVTVIPGNHDAYIARGIEYFADIFAPYHRSDEEFGGDETWPIVRVRGPVAIIGLSTSRQTPWFTAYGRLGAEQLERLGAVLGDERLAGKLRVVAIHHPPAGKRARNRVRGLRDHAAFAEVIARHGAELILHGHEHRDLHETLTGPDGRAIDVLGVPSGTYEGHHTDRTARYRIFEISDAPAPPAGKDPSEASGAAPDAPGQDRAPGPRPAVVGQTLRRWDSAAGCFIADTASAA